MASRASSASLLRGSGGRAPSEVRMKPPEAESFLRIGHPKEGANWPRVLHNRRCMWQKVGGGRSEGLTKTCRDTPGRRDSKWPSWRRTSVPILRCMAAAPGHRRVTAY